MSNEHKVKLPNTGDIPNLLDQFGYYDNAVEELFKGFAGYRKIVPLKDKKGR
jgi:hypothetical protein